ncbi:hypothetical protein FA95DRAFT_590001 [Auriscalpium vulgare]|uniref:Uncharacterized protein n=1 Tax=Auriscalpium vulgare TaxID=40419 RepID=A0ACB8REE7_9AGAM|nr:hypothetical protein FA95DRAFT_590001 [Auriscalpium vulgare]
MGGAVRLGHSVTLGVVIFFSIITLSISAWLSSRYSSHHNYINTSERDRVRFLLFCSVWTIVLAPVFLATFLVAPAHIIASVAAHGIWCAAPSVFKPLTMSHFFLRGCRLFVTWVFWLSGAASLAQSIGGRLNCSRHFVYCGQINALEAFAWIIWVILTFALVFVMLLGKKTLSRGEGPRGPLVAAV